MENLNDSSPPATYWQRYKSLPRNVWALSFVSLSQRYFERNYLSAACRLFWRSLGASPFAIGVIEGIAETTASLLKLFSGYLSDKFDRRKLPVFIGYSLASVTRPMLAFVTSW
jgi:sugar phosphate permease